MCLRERMSVCEAEIYTIKSSPQPNPTLPNSCLFCSRSLFVFEFTPREPDALCAVNGKESRHLVCFIGGDRETNPRRTDGGQHEQPARAPFPVELQRAYCGTSADRVIIVRSGK